MTPDPILSGSRNCKKKLCEKIEKVQIQVEENGIKLDSNAEKIEKVQIQVEENEVKFLIKENGDKLESNGEKIEEVKIRVEENGVKLDSNAEKIEEVKIRVEENGVRLKSNGEMIDYNANALKEVLTVVNEIRELLDSGIKGMGFYLESTYINYCYFY